MRNAFNILAGIALLVGAVAPMVHAAGTNDPYPTDPKEPWPEDPKEPWPEDPKEPWPEDPKEPWPEDPKEPWPEDPKEPWPEDPKEPWPEDPKEPWPEDPKEPWPEDPKEPWPPKDKCKPSNAVGGCPTYWKLENATSFSSFDKNKDGCVCVKIIPGEGKGNTGEGKNVKDNNNP